MILILKKKQLMLLKNYVFKYIILQKIEKMVADKSKKWLIRSNNLELLTEHPDLEVIITREDTSTGNSTEDVSTSTLEERLSTFLGNDLTESVEGRVILDSGTRGHHHTTTNGINRVRGKTGTGSDSPTKSEVARKELGGSQGA